MLLTYIDGKKWYDWCIVKFEPGVEGDDNLLAYFKLDKRLDKSQEKLHV